MGRSVSFSLHRFVACCLLLLRVCDFTVYSFAILVLFMLWGALLDPRLRGLCLRNATRMEYPTLRQKSAIVFASSRGRDVNPHSYLQSALERSPGTQQQSFRHTLEKNCVVAESAHAAMSDDNNNNDDDNNNVNTNNPNNDLVLIMILLIITMIIIIIIICISL